MTSDSDRPANFPRKRTLQPHLIAGHYDVAENNLSIQRMAISEIKPNARNSRRHSAKQIRQIAHSIAAFGFTNPLLVSDDRELIAGHGRWEAGSGQTTRSP
jgi:ParB-like nuclease domain